MDLYRWGEDAAITAFSLTINSKSFTEADVSGAFDIGLASADDSPLLIFLDLDTDNGGYVGGELEFPGPGDGDFDGVEGAALNDDPCEAAKAKGVVLLDSDFNDDCVTNLADFAILAAEWLESTSLEVPVP
jgi:hypothetical protein